MLEGLYYNPKNYELNWTLGFVYWGKLKFYNKGVKYALSALNNARDAYEIKDAIRLLAACYEKLGEYNKAVMYLKYFTKIDPADKTILKRLKNMFKSFCSKER